MSDDRVDQPNSSRTASRKLRQAFGDFRTKFARRRSRGEISDHEQEIFAADTPPDVASIRAKSSRHGKSTADKWNQ